MFFWRGYRNTKFTRSAKYLDTPQIKSDFETLYQQLTGKTFRELDSIIDTVTTLCWHHEKSGFIEGIKLGILLATELTDE